MHFNYSDILIMTDIDGTLAVDEKISEENIRAIKSFTQKGGFFTVASGRTPSYIKEKYLDVIEVNAPVASINGSIISKDEKVYFHVPMPDDCGKIIKKQENLQK